MLLLVGSIVLSSCLPLCCKVAEQLRINTLQAIVFNYLTCAMTGSLFNRHSSIHAEAMRRPWFPYALAMGEVLIAMLNKKLSLINRMGIVLPLCANALIAFG